MASTSKRRSTSVSTRTRTVLWARGAGRCYICNRSLIGDLVTGAEDRNFGFVAHIVAEAAEGPRGDPIRSPLLVDDIGNLILLCHVHHKLIDVDAVADFPESRLLALKQQHESRVAVVTGIALDRASHVVRYAANIGTHQSLVPYGDIAAAMLPERYPAHGRQTTDIELRGSAYYDSEAAFWQIERENLRRQFAAKLQGPLERRDIGHLSVFALAPQPLLMEFGRLIGDITPVSVHQRHREPSGWRWAEDGEPVRLTREQPKPGSDTVGLILAMSAHINPGRAKAVLGDAAAIWEARADMPHNDILRRADDLKTFRQMMRSIYDGIKTNHPAARAIHVFPALPVSAAVEVGRTWMPKADLPLEVYDENLSLGGFRHALRIE